jgi:hypothetical protein
MRYLMFTGNDDRTEVHRYSDDEVTEIFGKAAPALDAMLSQHAARHLGRYGARGQEAQLGRLHKLNQRSGKLNRPSGINPGTFFFAYRSPRQISSSTRSSCSR